jgi:hypothetical protein
VAAIQNYTISNLNSVIEIHRANKKASDLEALSLLGEGDSYPCAHPAPMRFGAVSQFVHAPKHAPTTCCL